MAKPRRRIHPLPARDNNAIAGALVFVCELLEGREAEYSHHSMTRRELHALRVKLDNIVLRLKS